MLTLSLSSIPYFLVFVRALIAVFFLSCLFKKELPSFIVILYFIGFATDVLDGILARGWHCGSMMLISCDGLADTLLIYTTLLIVIRFHYELIRPYKWGLFFVFMGQLFLNGFSFLKFGSLPSYHPWSAKIFGWSLFLMFGSLLLKKSRPLFVILAIFFGSLNTLEEIGITYLLTNSTIGVHSILEVFPKNSF